MRPCAARSFARSDRSAAPAEKSDHATSRILSHVDWDAARYHQVSSPQLRWGRGIVDRAGLEGDERVIDAGCGTGRVTAELLERLPHGRLLAVDISRTMLAAARKYLTRFGDRVRFVRADLAAIPVARWADVVFSAATFHWVRDHPRLFNSIFTALRPGGRLVAQCGGGPNLERVHHRALTAMQDAAYKALFDRWTPPWEFADAAITAARLRAAGFDAVETSLVAAPVTFGGPGEYGDFVTTVVLRPFLEKLPEGLRPGFVELLTAEAAGDDPPFTLDYWRLNLTGVKPGSQVRTASSADFGQNRE